MFPLGWMYGFYWVNNITICSDAVCVNTLCSHAINVGLFQFIDYGIIADQSVQGKPVTCKLHSKTDLNIDFQTHILLICNGHIMSALMISALIGASLVKKFREFDISLSINKM